MNNEQKNNVPVIPIDDVRIVLNTRYLFSETVKRLTEERVNACLGMSAVRDALIQRIDDMILEDEEAGRFIAEPVIPFVEPVEHTECMYFVKN